MTDTYDDPYLDYEADTEDSEEWQPGECDNCYGETVDGPLGPVYCACAIGQGTDPEDCRCGPPEPEAPHPAPCRYPANPACICPEQP